MYLHVVMEIHAWGKIRKNREISRRETVINTLDDIGLWIDSNSHFMG
jgi:hypothetical protein